MLDARAAVGCNLRVFRLEDLLGRRDEGSVSLVSSCQVPPIIQGDRVQVPGGMMGGLVEMDS